MCLVLGLSVGLVMCGVGVVWFVIGGVKIGLVVVVGLFGDIRILLWDEEKVCFMVLCVLCFCYLL